MSIFNDKALKGVTEAVAKIMDEELKGNQHKIDANKNGKVDAHDFKLLRAKKTMKEEEQLDELSKETMSSYLQKRSSGIYPRSKNKGNENMVRAVEKIAKKLKEEEQLDELSKSTVKSYVMKKMEKPTTDKKDVKGLTNAYNRLKNYKPTSESVDLDEGSDTVHVRNKTSGKELMIPAIAVKTYEKHGYFPVPGSNVKEGFEEMEKYRKEKEKESSFEKKKTDKGTAYSRKPEKTEKKVEEGFDDMEKYMKDKNKPQPSGGAGKKPGKAYGGSKQPVEKKSMTEMLELYNEHGLKVLSMMNTKSVKFGDTEVELLDADDVNGFVETVVEEVDNETFTKEVEAQKAKAAGKGKKAEVAKASVQAVEVQKEEAEQLDELSKSTLGSYIKKAVRNVGASSSMEGSNTAKAKIAKKTGADSDATAHQSIANTYSNITQKRKHGVRKAVDRLTKEAVEEFDEDVRLAMRTSPGATMIRHDKNSSTPGAQQHRDATAKAAKAFRSAGGKMSSGDEVGRNAMAQPSRNAKGNAALGDKQLTRYSRTNEEVELGEARKLEGSYSNASGHESKVYKLSGEHNEGDPYHVKLFKGGKHHEPADYFTNDKDDAHSTAKRMVKESLDERHLTAAETKEKEENVKGMKKNLSGFKQRYGERAKEVMYATATKQAKKD